MWPIQEIIALSRIGKISNAERIALVESTADFASACEHLGVVQLDQLQHADEIVAEAITQGVYIYSVWDAAYPESLRNINQPPMVLYVLGQLPASNSKSIAVVGTRSCTIHYGKPATEKCVQEWTQAGCVIVSGLANGVDTIAHETTLRFRGTTIAVVASGLGRITPIKAERLSKQIAEAGGAVISEHPTHIKALPPYFPARNRIISALSKSVVVVESKERGGGLITAKFALEMQRTLWALPGPITAPTSQGTNNLIATGKAKLLRHALDVLEEHGWTTDREAPSHNRTAEEQRELGFFEGDPRTVDDIAAYWECTVPETLSRLFDLEMKGSVQQLAGRRYVVM